MAEWDTWSVVLGGGRPFSRSAGMTALLVVSAALTGGLWVLTAFLALAGAAFEGEPPGPPPASVLPEVDGFVRLGSEGPSCSSCFDRSIYLQSESSAKGPADLVAALVALGWTLGEDEPLMVRKDVVEARVRSADTVDPRVDVVVNLDFSSSEAGKEYWSRGSEWWLPLVLVSTSVTAVVAMWWLVARLRR